MREDPRTCPDCGALITPQLSNCRQCGRYLHGTKLEGLIFQHLLPEQLRASPGTGLMMLFMLLYYVLMVMFAGADSALGFTSFSLTQLGSIVFPHLEQGQYWRFVTSVFAHGGVVHLVFNMYGLYILGPAIEEVFEKKKVILMFIVSGVLGMVVSYYARIYLLHEGANTVGASGAVCGLLGVAWVAAIRLGNAEVQRIAKRWSIFLGVWSLLPGVDLLAHLGGFLVGGGLAYVIPLGYAKTNVEGTAWSVGTLAALGLVAASVALMLMNLRGFPASLDDDAGSKGMLFFTVKEGTPFQFSSQNMLLQNCQEHRVEGPDQRGHAEALRAGRSGELVESRAVRRHGGDRGGPRRRQKSRRAPARPRRPHGPLASPKNRRIRVGVGCFSAIRCAGWRHFSSGSRRRWRGPTRVCPRHRMPGCVRSRRCSSSESST